MGSITLGLVPQNLLVVVSPGMDYTPVIRQQDEDGNDVSWPANTAARLEISHAPTSFAATWTPVVSGATITFNIDGDTVDAAPNDSRAQLFLDQGSGVPEQLWLSGHLVRRS